MEAMATGKPVVATAIPGHRGILSNGVEGLLVSPSPRRRWRWGSSGCSRTGRWRARWARQAARRRMNYSWTEVGKRVVAQYEHAGRIQQRVASLSVALR